MWQKIAHAIMRFRGWTLVGEIPPLKKAVFIAAPHTSNWDGFWLIVCKVALDIKISFLAKHTLFWWPLSVLLNGMGAIPLERTKSGANVEKLARLFAESDQLFLALAPEGTRKWRPHWRSGFYRIAKAANVPIVMTFIDFKNKRAGIGPQVDVSGTQEEIMARIRTFYETCTAAKPENMGPIILKPGEAQTGKDHTEETT